MTPYFLAIDIGASSGRHILGHLKNGRLALEEVYRFANGASMQGGHLRWNTRELLRHVILGLRMLRGTGRQPVSVGIDTWGLDFVLLDETGQDISGAVSYRDQRTKGIYPHIFKQIPQNQLYARTGIQMAEFNTLCQLVALQQSNPALLARAKTFLMMPDYLNYCLSGQLAQEYTNVTSTQMINLQTGSWDAPLLDALQLPRHIFLPVRRPGHSLGGFTGAVTRQVGYNTQLMLVASHDTASAFLAAPMAGKDAICVSSGTWSLLGCETQAAHTTPYCLQNAFSTEGGYAAKLLLKNSMGLWLIQRVLQESGQAISFETLCHLAEQETISSLINCNDTRFLAPASMTREIQASCRESGQPVPQCLPQTAAVVYQSLAAGYQATVAQFETIMGRGFSCINVFGGGANAGYLNRLIARRCGKPVLAGPAEATAIGNLLAQMLKAGIFTSVAKARQCVRNTFALQSYPPQGE